MKYLSILLISCGLLFSQSVSAQDEDANIMVFSPQGAHFYLKLDGRLQSPEPQKNLRIKSIPEGNYHIEIEFHNEEYGSTKIHTMVEGGKESSFMIQQHPEKGFFLEKYSTVPLAQVASVAGTKDYNYSRTSLEKKEGVVVNEEPNIFVSRGGTNTAGTGMNGQDLDSRRMGQTKITTHVDRNGKVTTVDGNDNNDSDQTGSAAPNTNSSSNDSDNKTAETTERTEDKEIVEVVVYKEKEENGETKIVRERHITTTTTIKQNGMEMTRSKKVVKTGTTRYNCLPRGDAEFDKVRDAMTLTSDKLGTAKEHTQDQCMAREQLTELSEMLETEEDKAEYAAFAKEFCADPWEYPLESQIIASSEVNNGNTDEDNNNSTNTNTNNNTDNNTTITEEITEEEPKGKGKKGKKGKKPKAKKAKKPKKGKKGKDVGSDNGE